MKKLIITEEEKKSILGLYSRNISNLDIVITEWLSPDEKYCIFLDEVYDIENKVRIGNIWENFDNFKMFLKHSFEVSTQITEEVRESVLNSINSLVITESNNNMAFLKPYVKKMLTEDLVDDAWNWGKKTVKGAITGTTDFFNTSIAGIKKTYNYIKDGDWKSAFDIIKKGALYVARKIRSALYHPIGLILDAILVATGIGKGAQFAIWAVVVGLDLYELSTGDYEDKEMGMGWRLLFLGVDIMGLVFAGAAAKVGKSAVEIGIKTFGKTDKGLVKAVKESPQLKGILEKILNSVKNAPQNMNKAVTYLTKNSPKMGKWLGGLVNLLTGFIQKIINLLSSILKGGVNVVKAAGAPGRVVRKALGQETKLGKGAQAGINTTAIVGGLGTYETNKMRKEDEFLASAEQDLVKTMLNPDAMSSIDNGADEILAQYNL
jgi:hypothetical protein